MVAVIANMHKDGLPVVVTQEAPKSKTDKKQVMLTSWASVATALLIVVLVGGAFYVADLKSQLSRIRPSQQDFSRTYEHNGERSHEDFHLNGDEQTELIIKKSDDGTIEMITALDYRRKISASYLPSTDKCVLLAGADIKWVDIWNRGEENETIKVLDDEVETESFQVSDNKVTDLSMLPDDIKPFCQGKPTYWLQPNDADRTPRSGGRQRRTAECRAGLDWRGCYAYRCGCHTCRICYPDCLPTMI